MNVLRLTNGDDVDQFLRAGDAGDVAYVDASMMPALEDTAFNLGRQIMSRRSSEHPELYQVRVNGDKVKRVELIDSVLLGIIGSDSEGMTFKQIKGRDAAYSFSPTKIKEALARLVDSGKVDARTQSGRHGGRPSVRFSLPE